MNREPRCRGRFGAIAVSVALSLGIAKASPAADKSPEFTPATPASSDDAAVERAFWVCDYIASTRGAHFTPVATCLAFTQELKRRKFSGDLDALVQWWQERKAAQHALLRAEEEK